MELIQEFKNYLLSQKKQPSKATVKNYVADVKKFITWIEIKLNHPFLPHAITKELIQDYKTQQVTTFSASSLDRQMSSLKKFFEFLRLEGRIGSNPFEAVTVKVPTQDPWHLKEFKDFLYVYNASHLTIKNYLIDVKQFFAWAEQVTSIDAENKLPNRNILSKLNDKMIEEYSQRLLHEGGFSPASINRKLSSLRKYLTWAHDQGLLSPAVTTLPANTSTSLLNEADLDEENANSGIDTEILEATTTLAAEIEQEAELPAPQIVKNESTEAVKTYSKIPPVRLFQKLGKLLSIALEYAVVIPLAHGAAHIKHRIWILKGKPVFTRTDVKLPEKLQPFRSHVKNLSKKFYNPWGISTTHFPIHKKVLHHIQYTRPAWYRRYSRLPAARYFNLAILMVFCAMIGFGLYSSFFSNARKNPTLAALPTAPPRVLSFQGRLTDNNDNPITTANTHLRFAIYNDASASGSALLWQEVDTVSPDTDGDFSTMLGNVTTIPQSLFAQNNALWLGVTVETTPELAPRQQIATVAFATNAETLQGLPPLTQGASGASANANTVLVLDSAGNVDLGQVSSTIQSSTGQFTLSGKTLTLTTATGSNTNIQLAPDGSGTIDLQKPLQNSTLNNNIPSAAGSVEVDDLLSVLATSSGQSAFTINQNSTGPLISASTSGVAKFTVDSLGNVTAAGNITGSTIYAGGGTSYYINSGISNLNSLTLASNLTVSGNVASDLIPALPTDTYSLGDASHEWNNLYVKNLVVNGSAFAQYWQLNNSVLAPGVTTNDLAVGGNSTGSAKFQVFATSAGAQPAGTASTSGNFTFNGATNPAKINLLNGTSLGFYSASSGKGDAGLSSTPTLYVANAGNVGIGNNSPSYSLDVTGNLRVTSAGGFGGALPGATVQGQVSSLAVTGYTGLGGLRINGTNTTDTIYNGTSNIFLTRDTGGFLGLTQTSTPSIGLLVNTTTGGVGINTDSTGIGNGQLVVNQSNISGLGDIIAASAAGSTVFTVANNGDVTGSQFIDKQNSSYFLDPAATSTSLAVAGGIGVGGATPSTFKVQVAGDLGPNANNAYDLGSYSSNLQWRNIYGEHLFSNGTELSQYWQRNAGALSPLFITDDLLVGGTSTASAKFAFMNVVGSGIPTASISAGTGSNTYLTADGTLATTALQALTLGSSTTGDINIGTSTVSKNITVGGTSQTGSITLGQSTASNAINIGNNNTTSGNIQTINIGAGTPTGTGKANITIGNTNDFSSLKLVAGNGNIALTGATATNYSIGDSFSTGSLTLGQSTAGQAINIGNAINTVGQVIQIANGNSAGNSDVDILSGNGTAGIGTLHLADNPRVNNITLGNVAPSGARTITIAGGNAAQNDTVSILNGAPSAGTQTVSILSGAATGGTQILNLGSATSTTTIKGSNFVSGSVAYATSNTLQFTGPGSAGQCLLSNAASAPSWGLCTYGNGNYWNVQQGTLFPINATLDFLIGANAGASSSAKFAVTNIAGTTPYASVSAVTSGGGTGTGVSLGGDGTIQSLVNGTLTIGGNTTGNIVLKPLNGLFGGSVTLSGYSSGIIHSTNGLLTASAVDLASADVTGVLPKTNGGTGQSTYTNGDMLYYDSGTSTTALTKLSIGADNSILNVDSSTHLPKWTSSPTLSGLTVTGTATLSTLASSVAGGSGTVITPTTNGTLDLGNSTHYFGTIYANNLITPVGNGTQGFWQLTNNVISPVNSFYDLAVGGSSTSSATPWQVFGTSVGYNTAGTATSSANLTFRGSTTAISQLNGYDLNFKVSPGGDEGLSTVLTLGGNKNVTVANDLAVNGSNLTSSTSTFNLFNTTVNTLNIAGVAANINVGRGSTTTTLNGNLVLNTPASSNTITIYGNFISSLVPNADNTYDLGTNGLSWRNAYLNNVFGDAAIGTQGYWQVTSNGNVISPAFNWQDLGLGGTATSSAKFQIYGSSFATDSTLNSGLIPAGTATSSGFLTFRGGATDVNLLNNSSLGFYTSVAGDAGLSATANPSLFVANKGGSGYVGIGTNNPGFLLSLSGGDSLPNGGAAGLKLTNTASGGGNWYLRAGATGTNTPAGGLSIANDTNYWLTLTSTGSLGLGTLNPLATLDIRGNLGTSPVASLSGQTSNAALIANNDGLGDIFTASASGTPEFTIANDGTIKNNIIPNITDTYNLGSDPSLPGGKEWDTLYVRQVVTPTGSLGSNYWQLSNQGTLAPLKSFYDLVVGGNSTDSAKFQVFADTYAGHPAGTASVSGDLTFNGNSSIHQINLLNSSDLGIYTSTTDDSGLSTTPLLYLANTNNRIGIGTSNPGQYFSTTKLEIADDSGNSSDFVQRVAGGSFATHFFASSNGTAANPTAITSGNNILGEIDFRGFGTSVYRSAARILAYSDGAYTNSSSPGYLTLSTTSSGSSFPTERMRITSSGNIGIGTTTPQGVLDVASNPTNLPSDLTLAQAAGTNLMTNPSFETGTTGWNLNQGGTGGTAAVSSATSMFGSKSILITTGTLWTAYQQTINVSANTTYTLSAWVKTSTASNAKLVFSDQQAAVTVYSSLHSGDGKWQRLSVTLTTGASTTTAAVGIQNGVSSATTYADAFQLETGSSATPYIDGSLGPGYHWTGAPNNSTSVRDGSAAFAYNTLNSASGIGAAGRGSSPTLQLDQDGTGDLIVASAAGTMQFSVSNSGVITANSFLDAQNTNYFLDPAATGTSASLSGSLTFNSGSANSTEYVNLLNNNNLTFRTSPGGDIGLASKVTITNVGNVGIGTTSPNDQLEIAASTGGREILSDNGGSTRYELLIQSPTASQNYARVLGYHVGSGAVNLALEDQGGNVGIGTTSPNNYFDVNLGQSGDGITFARATDNVMDIQAYIDNHYSDRTTYASGCCNLLALQPDIGNVSIGNRNNDYKLDVAGDIYANGGWFRVSGNQGLYFQSWGGGWYMADGTWIRNYNGKPVYLYGNGSVSLATGNGSVGVNTTSPYGQLNVAKDVSSEGSNESDSQLVLSGASNTANQLRMGYDTSSNIAYISATTWGSSWRWLTLNSGANSGGYVGIGHNPRASLDVGSMDGSQPLSLTANGNSNYWKIGPYSGYTGFTIYDQAGIGEYMAQGAGGWSNNSDQRLKTNIQPITDSEALSAIMQLNPVTFNWKSINWDQQTQFGLIAQQVQQIFPEFVSQAPDTTITYADGTTQQVKNVLGINYTSFVPVLLKAVQELDATMSAQQVQIATNSALLTNLNLTTTGDIAIQTATPSADFTIPSYYSLSDALGNPISQMGALAELVVGNLRVGSIQAQQTITNTLAVATDNVSIAGQSLHDYIVTVVNQVLQNTSGSGTTSPIADFDQIHTNLVSPLASTSAVAIDLQNSTVSVKNTTTGQTVASIDNSGNATFSGTLNSQNLAVNGDATISGTLHADKIEANSIAGLQEVVGTLSAQNITNVTNIYFATPSGTPSGENFATGSGSTSNNSNSLLTQSGGFADIASFSAYLSYVPTLHATTGMFEQGLVSMGPTSLTDTSIAGTLTVGSQLMIADTTINVLGGDLQIQPLRQGGIAFAGGLVHIDSDGNLNVNGKAVFNSGIYASTISPLAGQDLSIQLGDATSSTSANPAPQLTVKNASGSGVFAINQLGDIVASGAANISKLNFNFVQPAMALSDIEVVATGSAGTAEIKQFQTQVTIDDPNVTANSLIYITPVGTTDIPYLMRQVAGKSFTVGISGLTNHAVPFNWLIVN